MNKIKKAAKLLDYLSEPHVDNIKIDSRRYSIDDDGEICIIGERFNIDDFPDTNKSKEVKLRIDMTLKRFINIAAKLNEEDIVGIISNKVLNDMK